MFASLPAEMPTQWAKPLMLTFLRNQWPLKTSKKAWKPLASLFVVGVATTFVFFNCSKFVSTQGLPTTVRSVFQQCQLSSNQALLQTSQTGKPFRKSRYVLVTAFVVGCHVARHASLPHPVDRSHCTALSEPLEKNTHQIQIHGSIETNAEKAVCIPLIDVLGSGAQYLREPLFGLVRPLASREETK